MNSSSEDSFRTNIDSTHFGNLLYSLSLPSKEKEAMYVIFKIFIDEMMPSDILIPSSEINSIPPKVKYLLEQSGFLYVLATANDHLASFVSSKAAAFPTEPWIGRIKGNGKLRNDAVNIIEMICTFQRNKCNNEYNTSNLSFSNLAVLNELKHWAVFELALYDIYNKQNLSTIKRRIKYMETIVAAEQFFEPISDILLSICSYINKNVILQIENH